MPKNIIDQLKEEKVGLNERSEHQDLDWITKFPKSDLHCHLGGFVMPSLLKKLSHNIVSEKEIDTHIIKACMESKLNCSISKLNYQTLKNHFISRNKSNVHHGLKHIKDLYKDILYEVHSKCQLDYKTYEINAVLLQILSEEQIYNLMYEDFSSNFSGVRLGENALEKYTAIGNLGGSLILQTEKNLRITLNDLLNNSYENNVKYIEVRCSPGNYTNGNLSITDVLEILIDEASIFMQTHHDFEVNFLIMATRHKEIASILAHISLALTYYNNLPSRLSQKYDRYPRVCGVDLAGKEDGLNPKLYKEYFDALHYHFVNITIHAGEMTQSDYIWEAIYLLHAKRIGHGLKLYQDPKMMRYIRDYKLVLEMCPSSNYQTNTFKRFPEPSARAGYPLKYYLDEGIKVTINTDNIGISQTNISNEYLQAAQMTPEGISKWDILRIMKNGFKAAFLPLDEKSGLLKRVDKEVFDLVIQQYM